MIDLARRSIERVRVLEISKKRLFAVFVKPRKIDGVRKVDKNPDVRTFAPDLDPLGRRVHLEEERRRTEASSVKSSLPTFVERFILTFVFHS